MPVTEATPTPSVGTPEGLLAEVCDALDAELVALDVEGWSTPVLHDNTVRDLIIHLTVVNDALVERLRGTVAAPLTRPEARDATKVARDKLHDPSPEDTLDAWRRSVEHLRKCAGSAASVCWVGSTLTASEAVVERAVETWIVANDIRNAIGRASLDPSAQHLRVMCDVAVQLLSLALASSDCPHAGTLHVSLTGPGGGEWEIPLGDDPSAASFSLSAAARDLCLLFGQRIDPLDFAYTARGDDDAAAVARALVDAARACDRW